MVHKGQNVGHSDLVLVHDTAPSHDVLPHQVVIGHPASNSIEEICTGERKEDRQT